MVERHVNLAAAVLLAGAIAAGLSGCGRSTNDAAAATDPSLASDASDPTQVGANDELAQKEQELAAREAEMSLKQREQDVARREAALASAPKAPATTPPKSTTQSAGQRVAMADTAAPTPRKPFVVPAGTELQIGLSSDISTKTASVGDVVNGRLASDLIVKGKRVMTAGSPVRGKVTQVVSGSHKIGGVPTLELSFDRIELDDGSSVAISGSVVQQASSDTVKDGAKIVGGAAAGAIIGHQISHKNGKIIGGLLGGAAGAAVAQNTGGEVSLPAGSVLVVAVDAPFKVRRG